MDEQSFFADILIHFYGISASRLTSLNSATLEDGRKVYQMYHVEQTSGQSQILFAYHDDFVKSPTFWWGHNQSLQAWLYQRAELFIALAHQHYPAPRLLPSQAEKLIDKHQQWNFLVTSYIDGDTNVLSSENMFQIGKTLGRLHCLQLSDQKQLGPSWWNKYSIPHTIEQFYVAASSAPSTQRALCEKIYRTLITVQQAANALPEAIIHGDCWASNSVRMESQDITFIDWECAGRGAPILDLGLLLLRSQYNQSGNIPEEIDSQKIDSVISGYTKFRHISSQEEDLLLEAIRFGIAWGGAWIVVVRATKGWTPRIERLLERVGRGYDLAAPIALFSKNILHSI